MHTLDSYQPADLLEQFRAARILTERAIQVSADTEQLDACVDVVVEAGVPAGGLTAPGPPGLPSAGSLR